MRVHEEISTPGGSRANEDRAGHAGNLAWVIDGATDLYPDAALPAASDVQWLVDAVSDRLRIAGDRGYEGDGPSLLADVARLIGEKLETHRFPADRVPPACSLVVAIDHGESFEITRIGDATAAVTGSRSVVLATDFFDKREASAVASKRAGARPADVTAGMHRRRLETMTAGYDESVFSGHPARRLRPHRISGSWRLTAAVLLCTDGFARLLTDHRLYARWDDIVQDALENGLARMERLLRGVEAELPAEGEHRFKRADDVAAVLITSLPAGDAS